MAVVELFQSKREQFEGADGIPQSGGKLYVGTANGDPKTTAQSGAFIVYSDRAKTTPIDQSTGIPLNAYGRPNVSVWVDQSYSYLIEDADGNEIITEPYIEVVDVEALVQAEVDALAASLTTGYRNTNVNGGMQVANEDAPSGVTITSSFLEGQVKGVYGRATNVSAGTMDLAEEAGFGLTGNHFLFNGVTLAGASDIIELQDRHNSEDSLRYVDNPATVSFLVRHNFGADTDFTITVAKADSQDDFSSVTTIQTGSAASVASGVATVIELTVADMGDCSNGIAVTVKAEAGAITTKNLAITNSQIEQAVSRTTFEARTYKEAYSALMLPDDEARIEALETFQASLPVVVATEVISSTVAFVNFPSVFSDNSSYKYFRVLLEDIESSGGDLAVRVSVDGSTFISTSSYNWMRHFYSSNGTAASVSNSTSDTDIQIQGTTVSVMFTHGWIDFARPDVSAQQAISSHLILNRDSSNFAATADCVGSYLTNDTLFGFQILSGSFTAGTITVLASNRPF